MRDDSVIKANNTDALVIAVPVLPAIQALGLSKMRSSSDKNLPLNG